MIRGRVSSPQDSFILKREFGNATRLDGRKFFQACYLKVICNLSLVDNRWMHGNDFLQHFLKEKRRKSKESFQRTAHFLPSYSSLIVNESVFSSFNVCVCAVFMTKCPKGKTELQKFGR